ncbi:MAG: ribosome biogenesis GTPase Der [Christensenellaceae bacterium]|nr:ribosome biogenesis GTPase Der [Christensenellaceae bacterium]
MKTPLVAIVGRPNVGKSSLFNMLAGARVSITDDEPGVTRDRIYTTIDWNGHAFDLVDTGGVDFDISNVFAVHIREQVDIAIDLCDVIIFLTDGEAGVLQNDIDIANMLRKSKKPVVLAVNKLDNNAREAQANDFYDLKIGEPIGISCTQKRGLGDLLDAVVGHFKTKAEPKEEADMPVRIAIIGKPNAGKSSIVNKLLGEKRVMVSEVAGTTRDSIDTPFRYMNRDYILTDTAGIRRKRSVEVQTVEHYSVLRAINAIRTSDVSVVVIDATEGITEQDVRLAAFVHNEGKPSVIAVNKWDIVEGEKSREFLTWQDNLKIDLAFMPYFKPVFTSALTGQRVNEIMKAIDEVIENHKKRITTGKLNQMFLDFCTVNPTQAKIKYVTQVGICPPTFALFGNKLDRLPKSYTRYLENSLRKEIDFTGTPVRIWLRDKQGDKE